MYGIGWDENTLYLLNQTKLPAAEEWISYTDFRQVASAIQNMVVRGAPAIGIAAAYGYALAGIEHANLTAAKEILAASRPTAVNLFWALDRMERCSIGCGGKPELLVAEAIKIHTEDIAMNEAIGCFGADLVPHGANILTHCNAGALATGGFGTALGVIRAAHKLGKVNMVYADETRPLLQGARLTAYELVQDGIPATLIADNMAAWLMAQGRIDLVVVGCDRMAANGDFANKIGTYSVAVNAHHHGIPFYTALPSSTIQLSLADGSGIPIEERSGQELLQLGGVQTAPGGVLTYNPSFDVTPHTLLTGIITEKGIVYPPFRDRLRHLFT